MESYLAPHPFFFVQPTSRPVVRNRLGVTDLPGGWDTADNGYWTTYTPHGGQLANQGWKIHIGTATKGCQGAIDAVARECVSRQIPFKHVRSVDDYVLANAKNANPGTSGKLITVYPDSAQLEEVVARLASVLTGAAGPAILSDIPVSDCVGLRYGAFRRIVNGAGEYCLFDASGALVEDARVPFVSVPEFVEVPGFISELIDRMDAAPGVEFEVETVLRSSNAGCVAGGLYKGAPAILKQGRAHAGYDPELRSGQDRVGHEAEILRHAGLAASGRAPRLLKQVCLDHDTFIVSERLSGTTLHEWKRPRLQLYGGTEETWTAHVRETIGVCRDLVDLVEELHGAGVYHRDLHAKNILVDDGRRCTAVDFEEATTCATDEQGKSKAQGYYCGHPIDAEQSDWYAVRQVLQDLAFGSVAETALTRHGVLSAWGQAWVRTLLESCEELQSLLDTVERRLPEQVRVAHVVRDHLPAARITVSDIEGAADAMVADAAAATGKASVFYEAFEMGMSGLAFGRAGHEVAGLETPAAEEFWFRPSSEREGLIAGSGADLFVSALRGEPRDLIAGIPERPLAAIEEYGSVFAGVSGLLLAGVYALGPRFRSGGMPEARDRLYAHLDRIAELVTSGKHLPDETLPSRENRLARLNHGLFGGNLSLAWLLAAGSNAAAHTNPGVLDAIELLVRRELSHYESADGRLMFNQVNRLLPYLATGSAGIGVVAACLQGTTLPSLGESTVRELIAACDATYAVNVGLFNGWLGLWYGGNGLRAYAGQECRGVDEALAYLEGRGIYEDGRLRGFACDGGYRFTTDLATGMAGLVHALRMGGRGDWTLLPTGEPRGR